MINYKKEQGITLVALIVTIVVLLLISTILIREASTSANDVRLKGFYTQLELIEKQIDTIATTNEKIEVDGEFVAIQELGTSYEDLSEDKKEFLSNILQNTDFSAEDFRYFTKSEVTNYLIDLNDFDDNLFINFAQRCVIAEKGIKLGNTEYHMEENKTYYVEQNTTKNIGTITSLNYTVTPYGTNTYKVVVTPSNTIGDIGGTGSLKYKKTTTKYWESSYNMTIVLEPNIDYNIVYIDATGKNTIEKKINVYVSSLPSGYQEVEYIQSSGTQYIDTNYKPNNNSKMWLDYQPTEAQSKMFAGERKGSGSSLRGFTINSGNTNTLMYASFGDSGNVTIDNMTTNRVQTQIGQDGIYYNGELKYIPNTIEFQFDYTALLFNNRQGTDVGDYYSKVKIYECKIWENNVLQRHFIPCYRKSDEVIGMYDIVNNIFYINDGTGTFEKGEDVSTTYTIEEIN